MSELLPKQKGLLQIWKELKKGFKNNPDNLATFDTMANMLPPLAVYRGGQTLSDVPEKFQKGQYKDAAIDTALGGLDVVGGLMPMMGTMRMASSVLPKGVPLKQAGAVLGSGKIAEKLDPIHGSKVDAWLYENDKALNLSKLVANERNQGAGTAFMNDLVAEADKAGKRIDLSPSADFGGNKKRLEEFYKRFGFVPNKGRTKDLEISESMYRQPAMNMPQRPVNALGQEIPPTQYELAQEAARIDAWKNHGLPENNTAMDRARAMGFDTDAYHGTKNDVQAFDMGMVKSNYPYSFGVHTTSRPSEASIYANENLFNMAEGGNVIPLSLRKKNSLSIDTNMTTASMEADINRAQIINDLVQAKRAGNPFDSVVINRNRGDEWDGNNIVSLDPKNIRSRFAAFNMSNRDSADLLASYLLPTATTGALGYSLLTPNESWAR